jgi:hypothetical protein
MRHFSAGSVSKTIMYEHHFADRAAMIAAARSAILAGDFSQAEAILKSLLRADPDDSEAASLLASAVARNMSDARQLLTRRSNAWPSAFNTLFSPFGGIWTRQFNPPRSLHCWLFAFAAFLCGLAELWRSLPLMLAQGPDAVYTYTSKSGYPLSEPVSYAVGEASVMIFAALTFAAVAIVLRRRERL